MGIELIRHVQPWRIQSLWPTYPAAIGRGGVCLQEYQPGAPRYQARQHLSVSSLTEYSTQ